MSAEAARDVIAGLAEELATAPSKQLLTAVHEALIRVAAADQPVPADLLAVATRAIAGVEPGIVEPMPTRVRIVLRLLQAGFAGAAALVLADNAIGVVTTEFTAATSSGAPRTAWKLPILTVVESGRVYADLPGFRDPRFAAPDECYDISAAIRLRLHLDEVLPADRLLLAGWAALDIVSTAADEQVTVIAANGESEVRWPGVRRRRADLVAGTGEGLHRRAWAGWAATVDVSDLGTTGGAWGLSVELDHDGVVRRHAIGDSVSELAAAAVGQVLRGTSPRVRLDARKPGWTLLVTP